jgi:SAM-dependent methyltransferase
MAEWFEDEDFWITYAPLMFDESRWAEVPEVVDRLLEWGLTPGQTRGQTPDGRVLDICCGVGRHCLELAFRGFKVTGIDITKAYLEAAENSAKGAGLDIEFIRADARTFTRPSGFDLALNLYTSFGYFADPKDDLRMLSACASSLAPGGCLIIETLGKEVALNHFIAGEEFDRAGWKVRTEYEISKNRDYQKNRWILDKGNTRVDRSFSIRLYSGDELASALEISGFRTVELLGGFDGRAYDKDAETLVAVART